MKSNMVSSKTIALYGEESSLIMEKQIEKWDQNSEKKIGI